jgi:hypothetical protein
VNDLAGPVALALVGLWVAYLVPTKVRHRQQLLESRVDDRFSQTLRVVAVTHRDHPAAAPRPGRVLRTVRAAGPDGRHAGTTGLLTPGTGLPAIGGRTGGTVDRPHAVPERITADASRRAAQARAARAAFRARRAAAARRRGLLAAVLLVATIAGVVVAAASLAVGPIAWIVPGGLLAGVVGLGRRAVIVGDRTDAELGERIAEAERVVADPRTGSLPVVSMPTPRASVVRTGATPVPVVGRAVRPSEADTEVFAAIVADHGEHGGAARHATGAIPVVARAERSSSSDETGTAKAPVAGATAAKAPAAKAPVAAKAPAQDDERGWSPAPVPPPTYVTKPAAPRWEPAPLDVPVASSSGARGAAESSDDDVRTPEAPVATSGSIDLNEVLARRRASGQ